MTNFQLQEREAATMEDSNNSDNLANVRRRLKPFSRRSHALRKPVRENQHHDEHMYPGYSRRNERTHKANLRDIRGDRHHVCTTICYWGNCHITSGHARSNRPLIFYLIDLVNRGTRALTCAQAHKGNTRKPWPWPDGMAGAALQAYDSHR